MSHLILQPAAGQEPQRHYAATIARSVELAGVRDVTPSSVYLQLQQLYPEGRFRVWGATPGPKNLPAWKKIREGDVVLFLPRP